MENVPPLELCALKGFVDNCPGALRDRVSWCTLSDRGIGRVISAKQVRGDESLVICVGSKVHKLCRSIYANERAISQTLRKRKNNSQEENESPPKLACLSLCDSTRQPLAPIAVNSFNFHHQCLLCARKFNEKRGTSGKWKICQASANLRGNLEFLAKSRDFDEWSKTVIERLSLTTDLEKANARFHKKCFFYFQSGEGIPSNEAAPAPNAAGRPTCEIREAAFCRVVQMYRRLSLNSFEEKITVLDMKKRMNEELRGTGATAYSSKIIIKKMIKMFGNDVIISRNTRPCFVWFRESLPKLIKEYERKVYESVGQGKLLGEEINDKKEELVKLLSRIIRSEIKELNGNMEEYPLISDLNNISLQLGHVPPTLRQLLLNIFMRPGTERQVAAIGQSIVQVCRPRSLIVPLPWSVACKIHHEFTCKELIDFLHSLGYTTSYREVMRFESNAALVGASPELQIDPSFIRYAADNVDHDRVTIDGHGTFHGMGMIAAATSRSTPKNLSLRIKRSIVTMDDLRKVGTVPIHFYTQRSDKFANLTFMPIPGADCTAYDAHRYAEILYKTSYYFKQPRPSWNGMMQMICDGSHPTSSIPIYLPLIDLSSSDETCIYSVLWFVVNHAAKYNVEPVLTFDQPLYWKALSITTNEPCESPLKKIVLLLGGFHTRMSFLGTIGYIFRGSGISEAMEQIYAPNSVQHILSGKAVSRAERAHFILETALCTLLMENAYDEVERSDENGANVDHQDVCDLALMLEGLFAKTCDASEVAGSQAIMNVEERLNNTRQRIKTESLTGELWTQYLDLIEVYRMFRKAELTGNWHLYLSALEKMLPFFAAAGHNNYFKSGWMFLSFMQNLVHEHPRVYDKFLQGEFVVRRYNDYWAGIPCDLFIEQTLIRFIKSRGGVTRAGGMTERQTLVWLLSRHICIQLCLNLAAFGGIESCQSRRNVDASQARQKKDNEDIRKVLDFFRSAKPFHGNRLRSIATGIQANILVNAHKAESVGKEIIREVTGLSINMLKLSKKNQVVTMDANLSVSVGKTRFNIVPEILFQRLTDTNKNNPEFRSLFQFEMSTIPLSLFDKNGLLRDPSKSQMKQALSTMGGSCLCEPPAYLDSAFVLDGGSLLHAKRWPRDRTYAQLAEMHVEYIKKHFGKNTSVIFDGYQDGPSTKDEAHARRYGKCHTVSHIEFDPCMNLAMKQEDFLSNPFNKSRFIKLLSEKLRDAAIETETAKGDADLSIASAALKAASKTDTYVVADDTDILVLLLHHIPDTSKNIFMMGHKRKNASAKQDLLHINDIKIQIGRPLCSSLLFWHAFLGCDTTSRIYGLRRPDVLSKVQREQEFQEIAKVYMNAHSSIKEVEASGLRAFVLAYAEKGNFPLNYVRYLKFASKSSSAAGKPVESRSIPPTEDAAKLHCQRVYHQVQTWCKNPISPADWGWRLVDGRYEPVKMMLPPAPEELLKIVRCNCKTDCSRANCTCKMNGLKCTAACGHCRGIACLNSQSVSIDDSLLDEEAAIN